MDDPDLTAPTPRDDGGDPPKRPTPREIRDMVTGNDRAAPPGKAGKAEGKAIDVEDLNAANDK